MAVHPDQAEALAEEVARAEQLPVAVRAAAAAKAEAADVAAGFAAVETRAVAAVAELSRRERPETWAPPRAARGEAVEAATELAAVAGATAEVAGPAAAGAVVPGRTVAGAAFGPHN